MDYRDRVRVYAKPQTIRPSIPNPITLPKCIGWCGTEFHTYQGSIKGRILRGFMVMKNGRPSIEDVPSDPLNPRPVYTTGRMCHQCGKKFKSTGSAPTEFGYIQLLKDNQPIARRKTVTQGKIEQERITEEQEALVNQKESTPFMQVGRIKIPFDDTTRVVEKEPEVHVNAFRAFMRMRKPKMFDPAINMSNQKK